jgi:hypothetical protein
MNYEGFFKKTQGSANLISQWLCLSDAAGANKQRVKLAVFNWQLRNGAQKLRGKSQVREYWPKCPIRLKFAIEKVFNLDARLTGIDKELPIH